MAFEQVQSPGSPAPPPAADHPANPRSAMSQTNTIIERFDSVAHARPNSCAVEGDEITLSFRQLQAASDHLAGRLLDAGVRPGDLVPVLLPRSPQFVVSVLAILRCGAAYAPIDPQNPTSRRNAIFAPLHARVCIDDGALDIPPGLLTVNPAESVSAALARPDADHPPAGPAPAGEGRSPAYVMYTSGSTGEPKGVVVTQRGVLRLVLDADYADFGPSKRWGLLSAVAFDASTLELWGALLHGGCCVVQEKPVPTLDELARFISERRITDAWLTAALFNAMEDHWHHLRDMEQLFTGGERASAPHIRRFLSACPRVRLVHGYGPTENTTFSLCRTLEPDDITGDEVPIGAPIHASTARIVAPGAGPDPADPEPITGELLVGGDGLALGYLNRPDLTAERFVHDSTGVRWYRTGDAVLRRADGMIVYTGRIDRQVKIRGHRIELDEVEAALQSCAGVCQAAVIIVGEGTPAHRMVGVYTAGEDSEPDWIREALAQKLPPTMIPQQLIRADGLPRGSTGKVDRDALARRYGDAPALSGTAPRSAPARDCTPTETTLLGLVRDRLDTGDRPLDPGTDLLSIGGHSLLAMRLAVDIQRETGAAIEPVEILRLREIGSIARLIDERREAPAVTTSDAPDHPAIGSMQLRCILESERDPTHRAMLVHQAWLSDKPVDAETARSVWRRVLARHEILRTTYTLDDAGIGCSQLDPDQHPWFSEEGVLDADPAALESTMPAAVTSALDRGIGAGAMPLRVHHWQMPGGSSLIGVVYHHAVVDEWSLDIIEQEFIDLLSAHEPTDTPEQYGLYIGCEHAWRDEDAAAKLAEAIAGTASTEHALPAAGPQPGTMYDFDLSERDGKLFAEALDALAATHGVTPASAILTTFGHVLIEVFGDPGRWVLTPISKRVRPDLQGLVGCCLDMRPIDTGGHDTMDQQHRAVQDQLHAAQGRSTLALDTLIDRLRSINPGAVEHVTRFGLTYRVFGDPLVSSQRVTLRRLIVPQGAARFGLALHLERRGTGVRVWFEASEDFFDHRTLESLARLITRRILGDSTTDEPACPIHIRSKPASAASPHQAATASPGHSPGSQEVLAELWSAVLGSTPEQNADFYASGGSSLCAMKLAGLIHTRMGLKLHTGEFLRYGTFAALLDWVRDDPEAPYSDFRRPGASRTGQLLLALPGASGRAVDLHGLWTAYSRLDPAPHRMIGCDFVTIAQNLDLAGRIPEQMIERVVDICLRERADESVTLLGYSMGGLVAVGAADRLVRLGVPVARLVLIDAYAPAFLGKTKRYYAARMHAELRRLFISETRRTPTPGAKPRRGRVPTRDRELWNQILSGFLGWKPPPISVPTVLIRSASGSLRLRPLYAPRTNGLARTLRGPVSTITVDVDHLAMLTSGSAVVARAIAEGVPREETRAPR